ncbi:sensor histidine kinase [Streptococcus plurextorum]|uniref:sensor histidine kinase n=1 Tax=Streptococcus plurextorum TaxID=456876 RepID=UPI000406EC5A|nr:HAMP domain-containing sensor histidine kinase [Streptococcus plurextorum]
MLIFLLLFFVIVSAILPFFYRSREAVAISCLLLSVVLTIGAVVIYIAKKGGIEDDFIAFFFLNKGMRDSLRYLPLSLYQLGFLLAIGRCFFPYFLLKVAVSYSLSQKARSLMPIFKWISLINLSLLMLSSPPIYTYLITVPRIMDVVIRLVNVTLIGMVVLALGIIYKELVAIELIIFKRQFFLFSLLVTSVTGLYLLYFVQEPGQIYYFYLSNYVWQQGVFYLRALLPIRLYYLLVFATIIVTVLGAIGLVRYIQGAIQVTRQEVAIRKKAQLIAPATSMFIHGMKNQLLSHQILTRRLKKAWQEGASEKEIDKYITALEQDVSESLDKINRFYKSLRVNTSYLVPVKANLVLEQAITLFHQQYPSREVQLSCLVDTYILADQALLSEAIANLLANAHEAILQKGDNQSGNIMLNLRNVRAFTVIEVKDNGCGVSKRHYSKIFEPFYSQKNSSTNWGMGLYFVRGILKDHFGGIYCDSKLGVGTTFTLYLPKYQVGGKTND